MAKDVIIYNKIDMPDFNLNSIAPNSDTGLLSYEIPEFKVKLSFKENNQTKSIVVTEKSLKIKNYGNFMRLLHDSRIESMAKFVIQGEDNYVINRNVIEQELDSYDTIRPKIFSKVFEIEKSIVDNDRDLTNKEKLSFRSLIEKINIGEDDKEILISIRNKFGHNEYAYSYEKADNEYERILSENPELPTIAKKIRIKFEEVSKANSKK